MKILGICSIALDTISKVDHLPIKDSFCTVLSTEKLQGGSGTNVLIQAQKLGEETGLISKVASDSDSEQIIKNLKNNKIDSRGVVQQIGDYAAPHCLIYVDPMGEKTLILDREYQLPALTKNEANLDLIAEAEIIYLDLNPAVWALEAAKLAKLEGKKVVLNIQEDIDTVLSRNVTREYLLTLLKYIDVFAPCQEGIKGLSGVEDIKGQIRFIRKYYQGLVILTLGDKGVVAFDESDKKYSIPALNVPVKDTTGAGDSFIGAFMVAYLINQLPMKESLEFSTACAAYTCKGFGAQSSPTLREVQEFKIEILDSYKEEGE